MEASRIYTLQGFGRPTVLEGVEDPVINVTSGAQWHTYGAVFGRCATPESPYLPRSCRIVAQMAHHINKYIRGSVNRRVAYVSSHEGKAVESLGELTSIKNCQPIDGV